MVVASAGAAATGGAGTGKLTGRFVQDRFAIGFWVDPPADQITDARYKEIADANFTFVLGAFGPKNAARTSAKQLALCQKYGLKAIVRGDLTKPENLPDRPACWGYHIVDEPNTAAIRGAKDRSRYHAQDSARASSPTSTCCPDYATAEQLGTPTYDDYVARFCQRSPAATCCAWTTTR